MWSISQVVSKKMKPMSTHMYGALRQGYPQVV